MLPHGTRHVWSQTLALGSLARATGRCILEVTRHAYALAVTLTESDRTLVEFGEEDRTCLVGKMIVWNLSELDQTLRRSESDQLTERIR